MDIQRGSSRRDKRLRRIPRVNYYPRRTQRAVPATRTVRITRQTQRVNTLPPRRHQPPRRLPAAERPQTSGTQPRSTVVFIGSNQIQIRSQNNVEYSLPEQVLQFRARLAEKNSKTLQKLFRTEGKHARECIRSSEHGDCVICTEEQPLGMQGCTFCKNAVGCKKCCEEWFLTELRDFRQPSCPLCRAKLLKGDIRSMELIAPRSE